MKLIGIIISELVNPDKSISSPLLKAKVLASQLKNNELLYWLSNELIGYEKNDDLPQYRIFSGIVTGTYINAGMLYNNQPIPTIGIDKELEKIIHTVYLNQSISALDSPLLKSENSRLGRTFPAELTGLIQDNWKKMGNPYLQLMSCRVSVSAQAITEVLSSVRNSLLDFMLKIDNEFGNIVEIEELKTKGKEISTIMSQTIINTSGNGNVVNTVDKSIKATVKITKSSKDELVKYLTDNGVSEADTTELVKIIDSEEPNREKNTFGKGVNEWIKKMLSKALDGSWKVGIGAAGSLLAKAIGKYYENR